MLVQGRNHWFVYLTLFLAFLLSAWPLPIDWLPWRAPFLALVIIYWLLYLPQHFGMIFVFVMGLLLDVLQGTPLGVNAMGLSLVGYGVLSTQQRLKQFALVQQSAVVFMLLGTQAMVVSWMQALVGYSSNANLMLIGGIWGALLWPLVRRYMRRLSWYFRVE
ncbi:MAG: rod shape-determining protein MreD [Cellvibrionaceae bacterium]